MAPRHLTLMLLYFSLAIKIGLYSWLVSGKYFIPSFDKNLLKSACEIKMETITSKS